MFTTNLTFKYEIKFSDLMETDSSDSMSFNQILKAKEVHIFK